MFKSNRNYLNKKHINKIQNIVIQFALYRYVQIRYTRNYFIKTSISTLYGYDISI